MESKREQALVGVFVVIAAGGGKDLKSKSGGVYVAFALEK